MDAGGTLLAEEEIVTASELVLCEFRGKRAYFFVPSFYDRLMERGRKYRIMSAEWRDLAHDMLMKENKLCGEIGKKI